MGGCDGSESSSDTLASGSLRLLIWLVDTGFMIWILLASAVLSALVGFFLYIVVDRGPLGWILWAMTVAVGLAGGGIAVRAARADPDREIRDDLDDTPGITGG